MNIKQGFSWKVYLLFLVVGWVMCSGDLVLASTSRPKPRPNPAKLDWHLGLEVLTDVPMSIGGKITLEGPLRLRLNTSIGFLPPFYVDLINAVVVGVGGYNEQTAELIKMALSSSLVWRTHLGWRPFARHGFYFEAGYTLVSLGGGVGGEELIAVVTGKPAPQSSTNSSLNYSVHSTLHILDIELGWEWILWKHLTLRAGLGFAATIASKTSVQPQFSPRPISANAIKQFSDQSAEYLDTLYKTYVFTPVISIAVGYRFF